MKTVRWGEDQITFKAQICRKKNDWRYFLLLQLRLAAIHCVTDTWTWSIEAFNQNKLVSSDKKRRRRRRWRQDIGGHKSKLFWVVHNSSEAEETDSRPSFEAIEANGARAHITSHVCQSPLSRSAEDQKVASFKGGLIFYMFSKRPDLLVWPTCSGRPQVKNSSEISSVLP